MNTLTLEPEALSLRNEPSDASLRRVCFVCTGNTCRSPMAEAVTNHLAKKHAKQICAASAGLYAKNGDVIAANAIRALENAKILSSDTRDYHLHTAHTICAEEAERYDLIVGLTDRHALELILRFPNLTDRITCLTPAIPDPFGGDLSCYEKCLASITDAVSRMLFPECL